MIRAEQLLIYRVLLRDQVEAHGHRLGVVLRPGIQSRPHRVTPAYSSPLPGETKRGLSHMNSNMDCKSVVRTDGSGDVGFFSPGSYWPVRTPYTDLFFR